MYAAVPLEREAIRDRAVCRYTVRYNESQHQLHDADMLVRNERIALVDEIQHRTDDESDLRRPRRYPVGKTEVPHARQPVHESFPGSAAHCPFHMAETVASRIATMAAARSTIGPPRPHVGAHRVRP